jgi:DNA (cytosine-5)-methyltransferase 1
MVYVILNLECKVGDKMLKLATVFSGIGAIEHALQRMNLKYEIVFACDIDKFVKQSYFANYDITEDNWYDDIRDLDGKKYKNKVDLFVGGSPCQSFSLVGKRKGLEDARGQLIFEFCRLVKEIQPKMFIYENVKGILNHDNGKTWDIIKNEFKKLGYNFTYKVMNSKNYGIPQNRERLFLVAFKDKKIKFEFPQEMKLKITMQDLLEDNPNSKYYLNKKGIEFVTSEKNLKKKYTQINGEIALCQKANQQFNWHGDFIMEAPKKIDEKYYLSNKVAAYVTSSGTKNFYTRPQLDLPIARPLLSTMHKMHRAGVDNYITEGNRIRKLTPRECLRLMGFDDRFKIVVSDTQMYKQAGNSIVVNNFVEILKNIDFEKVLGDSNE